MTKREQEHEGQLRIESEGDIVAVRKTVRGVASNFVGFGMTDVTRIVTASSELARNVFHYAGTGFMRWKTIARDTRAGVELTFIDMGPGIPSVEQALEPGYSTSRGLGMGLPGAKRLMDEMTIESKLGKGTIVTVRKWRGR